MHAAWIDAIENTTLTTSSGLSPCGWGISRGTVHLTFLLTNADQSPRNDRGRLLGGGLTEGGSRSRPLRAPATVSRSISAVSHFHEGTSRVMYQNASFQGS